MTITARFFEVGSGSATVIRFEGEHGDAWLVYDTNCRRTNGSTEYPVYDYLKKRDVQAITLVISHFHADHYRGVRKLFQDFEIEKLVIPPILSRPNIDFEDIVAKYRDKVVGRLELTTDEEVGKEMRDLVSILYFISKNEGLVEEAQGPESVIGIKGAAADIRAVLPLARIRGALRKRLLNGNFTLEAFPEMNDASVVLAISTNSGALLLTADSTLEQWREHRLQSERDDKEPLRAGYFTVPHHGSRNNISTKSFSYLAGKRSVAILSADGKRHPHDEFFDLVQSQELAPFCTCLATQCRDVDVVDISAVSQMEAPFRQFLLNYADAPKIECQGDIIVTMSTKDISVHNTTGRGCVYDLQRAFS